MTKFFASVALLILASTSDAFVLSMYEAQVSVRPWVPTPQEHVLITVSDTYTGTLQPGRDFSDVTATVTGSTITITAKFAPVDSLNVNIVSRTLDVGTLPAGRYTVVYSSDSDWNPSFHHATMQFGVAEGGLTTVVEFYNAAQDHYFITANAAEIALLDNGTMRGWKRTGESFKVMFGESMQSSAKSVCRFYGLPSAGLDSHFFAASKSECIEVLNRWPNQWQLETTNAFGVTSEAPVTNCLNDTQPLYRLYNNRADVNHRYTTSKTTRDVMVAKGWVLEGSAFPSTPSEKVAMCVPI